jgi:hypothetical protein
MTQSVIHQPRVAWDGARAFVQAAGGPDFNAFAGRVFNELGIEIYGELSESRKRILTALAATGGDRHAGDIELGRWRVRLEDLLRGRSDLIPVVQGLIAATH